MFQKLDLFPSSGEGVEDTLLGLLELALHLYKYLWYIYSCSYTDMGCPVTEVRVMRGQKQIQFLKLCVH
jgi:hypothetical protein